MFVEWVEYFAKLHKIVTVAVPHGSSADGTALRSLPPQYTSQDCSGCGERVKKTLSERTHQCLKCGLRMHRDHNAAKNILVKGLEVLGVEKAENPYSRVPLRRGIFQDSTGGQSGTQACGENHLWLVESNFGWLSGLDEAGTRRGNSMESPTIITSAKREGI